MNREGTRELASERGGSGPSQGGAVLRDNWEAGIGRRVSANSTTAGTVGGSSGTSTQSLTFTNVGQVATLTYPQLSGVGPSRTITNTYTNGWLTRVSEGATTYASAISYHANGMVNQVSRGNGYKPFPIHTAEGRGNTAMPQVRGTDEPFHCRCRLWTLHTSGPPT